MKKTYITPALNVVELRGLEHQMVATSMKVIDYGETDQAWSREQEGDFESESESESFWK